MALVKDKTTWALTGAVVGAVAASLCCTLPFVAAVLGFSTLAAASAFAPWRPFLLTATLALLGLGFYFAYRPPNQPACEPEGACGTTPSRRWSRLALWIATLLVILFAAFPYYSPWIVRAIGKEAPPAVVQKARTERVVFRVEGMDCVLCAGGLQNSLRQLPGVVQAEVSYQDRLATLEFDPTKAKPSQFEKLIADAGYRVGSPPPTRR